MKKQTKRKAFSIKPKAPMLIWRTVNATNILIKEYMAIEAFAKGFAEKHAYDTLLDMQGVMLLAGQSASHRRYAFDYAEKVVGPVLLSIKNRYEKTDKLGVSGQELETLREFLSQYNEFWLRQPTELYLVCCTQLQNHYKKECYDSDTNKA